MVKTYVVSNNLSDWKGLAYNIFVLRGCSLYLFGCLGAKN